MNEPCELRESVMACEGHALVIGGPGSGKTTLALALAESLTAQGVPCRVLDGDVVRKQLCNKMEMP